MKFKIILALLASFFIGVLVVPNRETVVKCTNEVYWKQLKDIDDEALSLSAEAGNWCSEGFTAIYEQDIAGMNKVTRKIQDITFDVNNLATQRQTVLRKLGY